MSGERKKKSINQSLMWHDSYKPDYRPAAYSPQERNAKMLELRKIMGEKPQDRRLLTRYLLAEKVGQKLVQLKELEEQGLIDVKKSKSDIIEKMNKDIKRILRGK